jgi:hypothetical protein
MKVERKPRFRGAAGTEDGPARRAGHAGRICDRRNPRARSSANAGEIDGGEAVSQTRFIAGSRSNFPIGGAAFAVIVLILQSKNR